MKVLKPFDIAFVGLSNGKHEFAFDLNDDFFDCFESSEINSAELKGRLIMHKKSNMLDLEFFINGTAELQCDRCLENFRGHLDIHQMLYIKFGDRHEEQSDEVIIIPATQSHIDVAQYFYEFSILGLPAKKTHPQTVSGEPGCSAEILSQLEKYMSGSPDKNKKAGNADQPTDSRWDALKGLKFNS